MHRTPTKIHRNTETQKRAKSALPTDLWKTISAFANRNGGTLLLGVHQATGFTVLGVDDPATTMNNVASLCSDQMGPPVRAEITVVTVEGQFVVVVDIPPTPTAQRPTHLRKLGALRGSRLRVADGNRQLSEYEVSLLLAQRTQPMFDRLPVESSSLADLDGNAVDRFVERMRSRNAGIFSALDRREILRLLNVITIQEDGGLVPTRAGLLAFGFYPQHFSLSSTSAWSSIPPTLPDSKARVGSAFSITSRSTATSR